MRAAIILAAGMSRRFGRRDKLKERLGGRTLLHIAIEHARQSGVGRIILVGGHAAHQRGVVHVRRPNCEMPLSASVAAGLAWLRPIDREALILLADMPFASVPKMRLAPGIDLVRPTYRGQPGHPVLVRVAPARALLKVSRNRLTDLSGQALVRGRVVHVIDVDTVAALRRVRRMGRLHAKP